MPASCAIYTRISIDRAGEGLGVARQEKLCRELAEKKGWPVAAVYSDNSVSASNGKRRPEYERMLARLEDGTHDGVIVVDVDRLTRTPSELEAVIGLCDAKGIALANVSGEFDLATSDGRLRARLLGAVARAEVEKKSERQRRANEDAARRGAYVAGKKVFGWRSVHEPEPAEAEMIREAVASVLAGESYSSIAARWNAQGSRTPAGNPWTVNSVRTIENPRHAGLQRYKGEIIGTGAWDPIISRRDYEAIVALRRRRRRRGPPRIYLLSGFLRCSHCGGAMVGTPNNGIPGYVCVAPCLRTAMRAEPADEIITEQVLSALERAEIPALGHGDGGELVAALTEDEAMLEELAAAYARREFGRAEWMAAREVVERRIEATHRMLAQRSAAAIPADPREWWGAATVNQRRTLLGVLIDHIVVMPHSGPRNRFDEGRLSVVLADGADARS